MVWKIYIGNKSPSTGVSIECARDPSVEITESLAYVSQPIFTTSAPPLAQSCAGDEWVHPTHYLLDGKIHCPIWYVVNPLKLVVAASLSSKITGFMVFG